MDRTIWKVALGAGTNKVRLPLAAKPLYIREQNNELCLWFEVALIHITEPRHFEVIGTGWAVPDRGIYLGSGHLRGGALVLHVYEVPITEVNVADLPQSEPHAQVDSDKYD